MKPKIEETLTAEPTKQARIDRIRIKNRQQARDTDFIQGERMESFVNEVCPETGVFGHCFEIAKGGEVRTYKPQRFFDLILEAHCIAADATPDVRQKVQALNNAKQIIAGYISEHDLENLGYSFSALWSYWDSVMNNVKTDPLKEVNKGRNVKMAFTIDAILIRGDKKSEYIQLLIEAGCIDAEMKYIPANGNPGILKAWIDAMIEAKAFNRNIRLNDKKKRLDILKSFIRDMDFDRSLFSKTNKRAVEYISEFSAEMSVITGDDPKI